VATQVEDVVPTCLGEELVQLGLWAFSELGLDAAGTDVALCRASRRKSCTVSVPNLAAANLDADNDEAASPFAGEFRVGLMSLPARGGNDRAAGLDIGTGVGLAKPRKGRHESGIEGELGPVPKGERRPFATTSMRRARVCDRHIDIHVCKPDVAGNPGASLPANSRDGVF
ncbi:unnamed protein product, partial [Symbiodinium sp. KB8]